jgi:rhodanese-related sulfurtransferase
MNRAFLIASLLVGSWLGEGYAAEPPSLPPVRALPAGVQEVTFDEAEQLLLKMSPIQALDVRSVEERRAQGAIPGDKHLDVFRVDFASYFLQTGFDPQKPCLIYCALGGRARLAAEKIAGNGFTQIYVLKDGFNAWAKAGKPVAGKPQP